MPLPPALLAKLAKRGIVSPKTLKSQSSNTQNKENQKQEEEIIVENYDETENRNHRKDLPNSINGNTATYDNDDLKSSIDAKFMGYQCCPNKYNVWHECTSFCKEYWGEGKKKPSRKYMYYRKKMLEQHPLPENWTEVYDPGTGRFYYWDEENDVVSWLPPSHRRALITDSAARFREERHMVEGDKNQEDDKKSESDSDASSDSSTSSTDTKRKKRKYSSSDKESDKSDEERRAKPKQTRNDRNFNRRRVVKANDIDPMDPAAYSNIPRGTWSDGLNKGLEAKTGADTTAAGPLYQMRPYPNPGAVLRANAKQKNNDDSD
ncbi:polyglutamine-binding protein 1 [Planococcus citri]|uniref:polyglutamine-binding protein 1 n=1 Tax=Planococcus citri TaxID=170843 RepID=UPI0031F80C77